jgi:hypothetical protein
MQREESRWAVEVGCERFFGLSGYVSQPRRSTLGVWNYERLAMLATILQSLFIDPSWVALKSTCADLKQESGKKKTL